MTTARETHSTITVHIPLRFVARGGRKVIIGQVPQVNHGTPRTRADDALIKAIARAYRWRTLIEDGAYSSITELARDKGINQSYACRLLRLTLLAPDITEAVLDEAQHHLTLHALTKPLPAKWVEQRSSLSTD